VTALHGSPCYLVTELEWETMEDLRAAFDSPEGQATATDAAHLQELAPVRRMIFLRGGGGIARDIIADERVRLTGLPASEIATVLDPAIRAKGGS
jgi:hypothetical protein